MYGSEINEGNQVHGMSGASQPSPVQQTPRHGGFGNQGSSGVGIGRLVSQAPAPQAAPMAAANPAPASSGESRFKQTIVRHELDSFLLMASLSLVRKL